MSREVVIANGQTNGQAAAPSAVSAAVVLPAGFGAPVTLARCAEFVAFVRDYIALEQLFDKTLDYGIRREVRDLRTKLACETLALAADFTAAGIASTTPLPVAPLEAAEKGGAA